MATRTALITGGTSGIGKTTAELLHSPGWRVTVTGYGNVEGCGLPMTSSPPGPTRVRWPRSTCPCRVREHFGSSDLLHLNAGISRPGPLEESHHLERTAMLSGLVMSALDEDSPS